MGWKRERGKGKRVKVWKELKEKERKGNGVEKGKIRCGKEVGKSIRKRYGGWRGS